MNNVSNNRIIQKFGGTSVGSIERIENVARRVAQTVVKGMQPIVVSSAMSGETNRLVALAEHAYPNYRGPAYDLLLASGEQVAIALLAMALERQGLKAQPLLAHQLGIQTDSLFSKARIQNIKTQKIEELLEKKIIPVVAGFQGVDADDQITTLGRGGSDTSAVALAAALGIQDCEIYTDVPCVCAADPRMAPRAKEIKNISFEEMMEMASLGSKVLHTRSVEIAAKYGVRIHVRSSFEEREGTWIIPEDQMIEKLVVSAVTHEASTGVFEILFEKPSQDFIVHLFETISKEGVDVDIISQSYLEKGQRLAFSVLEDELSAAKGILDRLQKEYQFKYQVKERRSKVSVVGVGMKNYPGVAARFFRALADAHIDIDLVTTSEIKISAVIEQKNLKQAISALVKAFDLEIAQEN